MRVRKGTRFDRWVQGAAVGRRGAHKEAGSGAWYNWLLGGLIRGNDEVRYGEDDEVVAAGSRGVTGLSSRATTTMWWCRDRATALKAAGERRECGGASRGGGDNGGPPAAMVWQRRPMVEKLRRKGERGERREEN